MITGDDGLAVEGHKGEFHGSGPGGDDNVVGGKLFTADGDGLGTSEFGFTGDHLDLAGLGQLGDASREFGHDGIFLGHQFAEVDFRSSNLDAMIGSVVAHECEMLRGMEQGFAGNAAHVEARAAQGGSLVDETDLEAELSGAKSADVATGTGADYEKIEGGHKKVAGSE